MGYEQQLIGVAFKGLSMLISSIEYFLLRWLFKLPKSADKFESSAHISKVLWRYKEARNYEFSDKNDFLLVHQSFEHPSIILEDKYSLYSITEDEAVFVDCGDLDIFNQRLAFVYDVQFKNASSVVTLPMSSFHLISKQIEMPKVPIIHLANHGRCGSTLLTKVFQGIPKSLSISETNGFLHLAEMSRLNTGLKSPSALKQICHSLIMCTLKHAVSRKSSVVFLKCQNVAVYITDVMLETMPSMKQIYMYRQPLKFVQSYEKLEAINNWDPLSSDLCCLWAGIGNNKIFESNSFDKENVAMLSPFSRWALIWISGAVAFQNLVKKGYKIKSLKYEHLIENPSKTVEDLFQEVGLPLSELPNLESIFAVDSQAGTPFSSRSVDKEFLKKCLTPINKELIDEVNELSDEFETPNFWEEINLPNRV